MSYEALTTYGYVWAACLRIALRWVESEAACVAVETKQSSSVVAQKRAGGTAFDIPLDDLDESCTAGAFSEPLLYSCGATTWFCGPGKCCQLVGYECVFAAQKRWARTPLPMANKSERAVFQHWLCCLPRHSRRPAALASVQAAVASRRYQLQLTGTLAQDD